MASRLVWIKSHLLLPQPTRPGDDEQEEDPAEALARQLREYKRFKEAALALRSIEEAGYHTYLRAAPPPELERHLEADSSALVELLAAAQAALASAAASLPPESLDGMVVPFTLTIHDQIGLIRRVTAGSQGVSFQVPPAARPPPGGDHRDAAGRAGADQAPADRGYPGPALRRYHDHARAGRGNHRG